MSFISDVRPTQNTENKAFEWHNEKIFQKIHARTLSTAEAYSLLYHVYLQQTSLIMKYLPLDKSSKTDEMLKETGETLKLLFLMNEVKPNLPPKDQIQSKNHTVA